MRALIFILSILLILAAVIAVIKHRGNKVFGLDLSKNWLIGIILAELLLLILAIADYYSHHDSNIANDLLWYNIVTYHRGVLPIAGLAEIIDFKMNNIFSIGLLMFFGVLLSDYIILRVTTFIKTVVKK